MAQGTARVAIHRVKMEWVSALMNQCVGQLSCPTSRRLMQEAVSRSFLTINQLNYRLLVMWHRPIHSHSHSHSLSLSLSLSNRTPSRQ
jgi:hypothetical protein